MINKIALAGCGNVGTALLEILYKKKEELAQKYNFLFEVTMITDLFKGTVADPNGLDLAKVLRELHTNNSLKTLGEKEGSFEEVLLYSQATMLAEATPTNLETGEPGLSFIKAALRNGVHVTMTNKGPIYVAMDELLELARQNRAKMKYEGTIMSGTPLISMIRTGLAGCDIIKAEGILNGTTNYILSEMSDGKDFSEALKSAQTLGYAEANPTGDVEGWDSAVKVAILSKMIYNKGMNISEIEREGILSITLDDIIAAKREKCEIKLIASIERTEDGGLKAKVAPTKIPLTHPLAPITGPTNAITITTDNLGEVTLVGPGAGRKETGQALLTDLIAISKEK